MNLSSLLNKWSRRTPRPPRARPALEALEDRRVPAGVALFDAAAANWYLHDRLAGGAVTEAPVHFGTPGSVPVLGDWDGDGVKTLGVFDPATATWYLRNSNSAGPADVVVRFGGQGMLPVAGDWDGDGKDGIGVFDPASTN